MRLCELIHNPCASEVHPKYRTGLSSVGAWPICNTFLTHIEEKVWWFFSSKIHPRVANDKCMLPRKASCNYTIPVTPHWVTSYLAQHYQHLQIHGKNHNQLHNQKYQYRLFLICGQSFIFHLSTIFIFQMLESSRI